MLRSLGHDVVTAADEGLAQASDCEILGFAQRQHRILVTRDRDFGGLVFVQSLGAGVIYLRTSPAAIDAIHAELTKVLAAYGEADLHKAFVVVEVGRHRFRHLRS